MKICPKCNFEITNDTAKYCKNCGAKVETETIIQQTPIKEIPKGETFVDTITENPIPEKQLPSQNTPATPRPADKASEYVTKHTYVPQINGFFAFILWMIVLGGILSAIMGVASIDASSYYDSVFLLCSDISMFVLTPFFAIYAVASTYKRRSGSITLLQSYLIMMLVSKIVAIIGESFFDSLSYVILGTIWNIVFIVYIAYSEKVKDVFPKELRKTSNLDKIMIWCFILIPASLLLLGILELILFL